MIPSSFDEANQVVDKPIDMTRDECGALDTWVGQDSDGLPVVISCWKMTKEELEEVNKTGRVWCFHYGNYLQPHALSGLHPFGENK